MCMYNPSNSCLAYSFTKPGIIPTHNNSSVTARSIFSLFLLTIWCFNTDKSKPFKQALPTHQKPFETLNLSRPLTFSIQVLQSVSLMKWTLQLYTNNPQFKKSPFFLSPVSFLVFACSADFLSFLPWVSFWIMHPCSRFPGTHQLLACLCTILI